MSNKVRQIVECRSVGRNGHATSAAIRKGVLLVMADRADDEGREVFLSKTSITEITEHSKSTVKAAIAELCADRLIIVDGKRKIANGFTVNYRLNLDAIEQLPVNSFGQRQINKEGGRRSPPCDLEANPLGGGREAPTEPDSGLLAGRTAAPNHPLNHPETIREAKSEQKQSRGKRKSLFPENWRPDAKLIAFAASKGFNERTAQDLAESCVNHHRAKGSMFLDHGAAYRTWVINEVKYRQRDARAQRPPNQTATTVIGPGMRARLNRLAAGEVL
ncbi:MULTISPECIES: helix-turn-helix domain-containing protein [unclassified Sulfitobacter]|uniref:helix-turn-helix domain-containing protein n=1 Tax=unclassified Sulfitobacter TaxID=196795 RepID=UPI00374581C7